MQHPYFDKVREDVEKELKSRNQSDSPIQVRAVSLSQCKGLVKALEGIKQELKAKVEDRVENDHFKVASTACDTLDVMVMGDRKEQTVQHHLDSLRQNPTAESVQAAQAYLKVYSELFPCHVCRKSTVFCIPRNGPDFCILQSTTAS